MPERNVLTPEQEATFKTRPPESKEEIDAYLRSRGYDPDELAARARAIFEPALTRLLRDISFIEFLSDEHAALWVYMLDSGLLCDDELNDDAL